MPRTPFVKSSTPVENKIFLSATEAGRLLGRTPIWVCRQITSGALKAAKLGRGYTIRRGDLENFVEKSYSSPTLTV